MRPKKNHNDSRGVSAKVIGASPTTKKELKCKLKNVEGYVSPSKHDNGRTTTPRKRLVVENQEVPYTATSPGGTTSKRFSLFFYNVGEDEEVTNFPALGEKIDFGPFTITPSDLENVPSRKTVESQNAVMGESAKEAYSAFLDTLSSEEKSDLRLVEDAQWHWSHTLAFILCAGVTDAQVQTEDNLNATTSACNYTMLHSERKLRDLLKNKKIKSLEYSGSAQLFSDVKVAKNIHLSIKLTLPDGATLEFSRGFSGLQLKTEIKALTEMMFVPVEVVERRFKAAPEKLCFDEEETSSSETDVTLSESHFAQPSSTLFQVNELSPNKRLRLEELNSTRNSR